MLLILVYNYLAGQLANQEGHCCLGPGPGHQARELPLRLTGKGPLAETRQPCLTSPPAPKCEWVRAVNRGGSAGLRAHRPDSIPTTRPAGFMYNTFTTKDRNHLKGNMKTL